MIDAPTARNVTTVLDAAVYPPSGARYPVTDLGDAMAQSARVTRAKVGAEVITSDHLTPDMHTDLGTGVASSITGTARALPRFLP